MQVQDVTEWQVQCENCFCTLYYTDGSFSGVTGELCVTCEAEQEQDEQQE